MIVIHSHADVESGLQLGTSSPGPKGTSLKRDLRTTSLKLKIPRERRSSRELKRNFVEFLLMTPLDSVIVNHVIAALAMETIARKVHWYSVRVAQTPTMHLV
jgi:hypothetical protein